MLRHSVTIQSVTRSRTSTGGFTESWSTEATRLAAVNSDAGRKFYEQQQVQTEARHTVVLRYYDGLTTKDHRILFGTRALNIEHIGVPDEIKQWMVLLCKEEGA